MLEYLEARARDLWCSASGLRPGVWEFGFLMAVKLGSPVSPK